MISSTHLEIIDPEVHSKGRNTNRTVIILWSERTGQPLLPRPEPNQDQEPPEAKLVSESLGTEEISECILPFACDFVLGFFREAEPIGFVCLFVHHKELGYMIMEAEKSQNLQSASLKT